MTEALTELESSALEVSSGAFDAFCEDIAGMFGVEASGESVESVSVTLKELSKDFKKISAVFTVEGKGSVNGQFFVLLDQEALFTLAGTFVMLPENVIKKNRRTGRENDANDIADALGEVGNLLIGAWDRHFREEMQGHEHFLQIGTFIGKPWEKKEEVFSFEDDEELAVEKYKMTVEPFDPIICCAVFPKPVLDPAAEKEEPAEPEIQNSTETEETSPKEDSTETADTETANAAESKELAPKDQVSAPEAQKATDKDEDETKETADKPEIEPAGETEEITTEPETDASDEEVDQVIEEPQARQESEPTSQEQSDTEPEPAATSGSAQTEKRPVSKVIRQMTSSPATLPGELNGDMLTAITARNVMRTDIAWATRNDTVETTLSKMQQQNIGYVLVGTPDSLEGIISKSDIKGALSPYLQSIFSKWKRELDTATLQIKIRWVMSRPTHTVRPDTSLAAVMEMMSKHSVRSLPVADENGVCGIVTAYTVFNTLINAASSDSQAAGQNTDVPALS